ncbi:AcrR family transcriptional regulator [Prauserella isguenensis]|uniref:AcrR family transcriptional regulator n=1 Tax=Prauserella isguenensis TaxID=1470180 RepID=A0A839RYW5_9PSEU|nr:TetR/AcrR family transcriptional regulator [Prauserella isguenensis]MBB3050656.1 AcrR family transcriptional regulator [Prauserella isguenensis]
MARSAADSSAGTDAESARFWGLERSEQSRRLLTSGVRCFAVSGFHATTTRDITSAVGLSPGGLYVHFASKEQLLFEIIRTGHVRSLDTLRSAEVGADAQARLRELVRRFVVWHAEHHVVGRVSQYELGALSPQHHEEILELRRFTTSVFQDAVRRGIDEGTFADVDVHRVVRAILSLGVDLVRWYRPDGDDSPQQLGDFYAGLTLRMVTSATESMPPAGLDTA